MDGIPFIWDDNGNLIQDDTRVYGYDHSNWLTFVLMDGDTYNFAYNGLGDRLRQTVNGMPTSYWLDLSAGLTQVLEDGRNAYLYGAGRIGEEQPGGWQYHLGDAIDSVRQVLSIDKTILSGLSYDPFGGPTISSNETTTVFGFASEQEDQSGLVFLRARYYDRRTGRFISRDPLGGLDQLPSSLHRWTYAYGNPINTRDPSGLSPSISGLEAFVKCFDLHSIRRGLITYQGGLIEEVSVQDAIDTCKKAFSPGEWRGWEKSFGFGEELPRSAHQLFGWYVFEHDYESPYLEFGGSDPLTRELAGSSSIRAIRSKYYRIGDFSEPTFYPFNHLEQLGTLLFDWSDENSLRIMSIPIAQFIGSFWYQIKTLDNGARVGFRIDNDTTLESGSHIAGRQKPEYRGSVEALLSRGVISATDPLWKVIKDEKVISILEMRTRGMTNGSLGGGNIIQTFSWTEKRNACLSELLMRYLDTDLLLKYYLDIDVWDGYEFETQAPSDMPTIGLE